MTLWTVACQPSLFFTISQSCLNHVHRLVKLSNHLILCPLLLLLPSKYSNWINFGDIPMALHLDLPYSSSLLPCILNVWLKKKVLFSCSPIDGYDGYWQFCFYKQGCNNLAWTQLSQMIHAFLASWGEPWGRSTCLAPLVCFHPADAAIVGAQNPAALGAMTLLCHTQRELGLQQGHQRHFMPCASPLLCLVVQLYPTLYDPMDCSPPGSSVHGILQARILDWVAMPSSRAFS